MQHRESALRPSNLERVSSPLAPQSPPYVGPAGRMLSSPRWSEMMAAGSHGMTAPGLGLYRDDPETNSRQVTRGWALYEQMEGMLREHHDRLLSQLDEKMSKLEGNLQRTFKQNFKGGGRLLSMDHHLEEECDVRGDTAGIETSAPISMAEGTELGDDISIIAASRLTSPQVPGGEGSDVHRGKQLAFAGVAPASSNVGLLEPPAVPRKQQEDVDTGTLNLSETVLIIKAKPQLDIRVRPEWAEHSIARASQSTTPSQMVRESMQPRLLQPHDRASRTFTLTSFSWRAIMTELNEATIIPPGSVLQIIWDVMSVILVLHDIFQVPLQAFEPEENSRVARGIRWFSQVFWTLDVIISFRMGYFDKDDPVITPRQIAHHYLRTWFCFDVTVVTADWLVHLLQEEMRNGRAASPMLAKAAKTFKVFRAVRTIKMLRMLKLRRAFSFIEENTVQTLAGCSTPVLGIAKFVFAILIVCHFLCCLWYLVGNTEDSRGWVARTDIAGLPLWDRYLITFHWSLTQFGVGTSLIYPQTAGEHLCNIGILLAGLLVTALLVSSVTNTFSVMQQQTAEQYHQMWVLRRFCLENDFPRALSRRIVKHVERQYSDRQVRITINDVRLLTVLSKPLHAEVLFYVYLPPLSTHPFMRLLCRDDSYTMRQVASQAVMELMLAENDLVFIRGAASKTAFNAVSGTMAYAREDESEPWLVACPMWISEMVLWSNWVHQGDLSTRSPCRCLAIDSKAFCRAVRTHSDTLALCKQYAAARVEVQRKVPDSELSDLVEIERPFDAMRMDSGDTFIPELAWRCRSEEPRRTRVLARIGKLWRSLTKHEYVLEIDKETEMEREGPSSSSLAGSASINVHAAQPDEGVAFAQDEFVSALEAAGGDVTPNSQQDPQGTIIL